MAYPHKRHRFQKFIVFLFAIVIILLVSYFVALPKIKTKAAGVVAEKLLESQITSDTSAIAGVNAQEILVRSEKVFQIADVLTKSGDLAERFGRIGIHSVAVAPCFRFKRIYHKFSRHHIDIRSAKV